MRIEMRVRLLHILQNWVMPKLDRLWRLAQSSIQPKPFGTWAIFFAIGKRARKEIIGQGRIWRTWSWIWSRMLALKLCPQLTKPLFCYVLGIVDCELRKSTKSMVEIGAPKHSHLSNSYLCRSANMKQVFLYSAGAGIGKWLLPWMYGTYDFYHT